MAFFVLPYRVLFHDTMAYGSHHFLANFKFQCLAREQMFFEHVVDASEAGRRDHDDLILLTQQAYSRNLAPVEVGRKVAILTSVEEVSRSSVRFCFRVVRDDGEPVSCGFQTLVCISRRSRDLVPAPPSILRGAELMPERLTEPDFAARVLSGRLRRVFDPPVLALAAAVTGAPPELSYPRFVDEHGATVTPAAPAELRVPGAGVVLTFPGQGSFSLELLRGLGRASSAGRDLVAAADETCRRLLGAPLAPLIEDADRGAAEALVRRHPDLVQVGIYLGAVLAALELRRRGVTPDLLVGHSAGELAALAVAGAYSPEDGVELVCERARALAEAAAGSGGMTALFAPLERALTLLQALQPSSLEVAVVNHRDQVVVAGATGDLERFEAAASAAGLGRQRLQSPYPFHGRLMEPARARFAAVLARRGFAAPAVPVFSPIDGRLYDEPGEIGLRLAGHLVRPLDFAAALVRLRDAGARRLVESGAGGVLTEISRRVLGEGSGIEIAGPFASPRAAMAGASARGAVAQARAQPETRPRAGSGGRPALPVAIVGRGCVLPGAADVERLWRALEKRRVGIVDATELAPDVAADFLAPGGPTPDKTYTLLGGFIAEEELPPEDLPWPDAELARLSRAQRFLARALVQCAGAWADGPETVKVFLGATADGIAEYDEALLAAGLEELAAELAGNGDPGPFGRVLAAAAGRSADELPRRAPWAAYREVVGRLVGEGASLVTVDAACASSLYSIVLGLEALRRGECDLALCGGVFAPGPANSCLFSQFRGLSATGSRPLDASADGVVFGEGAAMLALKRLPEALAAGDRVHAVIAGSGLSSDGRSPSAAVPRREGQVLAMRRAYASAAVDPASVQVLEAHATATPVGDAVEVAAMTEVFGGAASGRRPIELGSVKGLMGHTGWVAGAASVLKLCGALEHRTVPPQAGFERPGPGIDLAAGGFRVSTTARPWPANGSEPRCAGVNAFGFGGSNAHLILQEAPSDLQPDVVEAAARGPRVLSVVGLGDLFPPGGATAFDRAALALPAGVVMLPDIVDDMDAGQLLAVSAAAKALAGLGGTWRDLHEEIGVVLGIEGKSRRALEANLRIYLDRVRRRLAAGGASGSAPASLDGARLAELSERLAERVGRLRPSGPYTLPGLMPNVAAGRVAGAFNLRGPNLVLGAGEGSLAEAVRVAADLLDRGEARLILTGGVAACARPETRRTGAGKRSVGEAAVLMALTTPALADAQGWRPLAELTLVEGCGSGDAHEAPGAAAEDPTTEPPAATVVVGDAGRPWLPGSEGAYELIDALKAARAGVASELVWPALPGQPMSRLRVVPATGLGRSAPAESVAAREDREARTAAGRAALSPIHRAAPRWLPAPVEGPASAPPPRRPLVLVDREATLAAWRSAPGGSGGAAEPTFLCPARRPVPGAHPVDLTTEESVGRALEGLGPAEWDALVAARALDGVEGGELLEDGGRAGLELLELLFVSARWLYGRLEAGELPLGVLFSSAVGDGRLHPSTGPFSGFVKAVARELPRAAVKMVSCDDGDLAGALGRLAAEWARGGLPEPAELLWREGARHRSDLVRMPSLAGEGEPWLDAGSVVLATGGARGVTAELAAELLERFGCTAVLMGRTDPAELPAEVAAMDDEAFRGFEPDYYRRQLAGGGDARPRELRARYRAWRAAREVRRTLERLRAGPGRVDYRVADLTDPAAVNGVLAALAAEHGRLDLVVHGAGLQDSRRLDRKGLEDFRGVVAAKIGGLANLHRACRHHLPAAATRFHLLTSAFSVFGNDGQPDYGAANEGLNRLAGWAGAAGDGSWTALAWLGWAGVGMTRGSEYAALARARGLRPVTPAEGRSLFAELVAGRPRSPVSVLVADGELAHYGVALVDGGETTEPAIETELTWDLSLESNPYLADHRVGGRPTLPGAVEAELAARVAVALRPGAVTAMRDTRLERFVKLRRHGGFRLRGHGRVVEDRPDGAWVEVRLLSDFVHASGRVLRRDVPHFSSRVWVAAGGGELGEGEPWPGGGVATAVPDPYLLEGSPVRLGGPFRCLERIRLFDGGRRARLRIREPEGLAAMADFLIPALLLDGLFRCSMIHLSAAGGLPVYVPVGCRLTRLAPGVNDLRLHAAGAELTLTAAEPRPEGEEMINDWSQATDASGRVLLRVEGMRAARLGEVSAAVWRAGVATAPDEVDDATRRGGEAHG